MQQSCSSRKALENDVSQCLLRHPKLSANTCLHEAVQCGQVDIVAELVRGKDMLQYEQDLEGRSGWKETPLMVAAQAFHLPQSLQLGIIKVLLHWGSNPLATDAEHRTPLALALQAAPRTLITATTCRPRLHMQTASAIPKGTQVCVKHPNLPFIWVEGVVRRAYLAGVASGGGHRHDINTGEGLVYGASRFELAFKLPTTSQAVLLPVALKGAKGDIQKGYVEGHVMSAFPRAEVYLTYHRHLAATYSAMSLCEAEFLPISEVVRDVDAAGCVALPPAARRRNGVAGSCFSASSGLRSGLNQYRASTEGQLYPGRRVYYIPPPEHRSTSVPVDRTDPEFFRVGIVHSRSREQNGAFEILDKPAPHQGEEAQRARLVSVLTKKAPSAALSPQGPLFYLRLLNVLPPKTHATHDTAAVPPAAVPVDSDEAGPARRTLSATQTDRPMSPTSSSDDRQRTDVHGTGSVPRRSGLKDLIQSAGKLHKVVEGGNNTEHEKPKNDIITVPQSSIFFKGQAYSKNVSQSAKVVRMLVGQQQTNLRRAKEPCTEHEEARRVSAIVGQDIVGRNPPSGAVLNLQLVKAYNEQFATAVLSAAENGDMPALVALRVMSTPGRPPKERRAVCEGEEEAHHEQEAPRPRHHKNVNGVELIPAMETTTCPDALMLLLCFFAPKASDFDWRVFSRLTTKYLSDEPGTEVNTPPLSLARVSALCDGYELSPWLRVMERVLAINEHIRNNHKDQSMEDAMKPFTEEFPAQDGHTAVAWACRHGCFDALGMLVRGADAILEHYATDTASRAACLQRIVRPTRSGDPVTLLASSWRSSYEKLDALKFLEEKGLLDMADPDMATSVNDALFVSIREDDGTLTEYFLERLNNFAPEKAPVIAASLLTTQGAYPCAMSDINEVALAAKSETTHLRFTGVLGLTRSFTMFRAMFLGAHYEAVCEAAAAGTLAALLQERPLHATLSSSSTTSPELTPFYPVSEVMQHWGERVVLYPHHIVSKLLEARRLVRRGTHVAAARQKVSVGNTSRGLIIPSTRSSAVYRLRSGVMDDGKEGGMREVHSWRAFLEVCKGLPSRYRGHTQECLLVAEWNAWNHAGDTALALCLREDDEELTAFVLSCGADVNVLSAPPLAGVLQGEGAMLHALSIIVLCSTNTATLHLISQAMGQVTCSLGESALAEALHFAIKYEKRPFYNALMKGSCRGEYLHGIKTLFGLSHTGLHCFDEGVRLGWVDEGFVKECLLPAGTSARRLGEGTPFFAEFLQRTRIGAEDGVGFAELRKAAGVEVSRAALMLSTAVKTDNTELFSLLLIIASDVTAALLLRVSCDQPRTLDHIIRSNSSCLWLQAAFEMLDHDHKSSQWKNVVTSTGLLAGAAEANNMDLISFLCEKVKPAEPTTLWNPETESVMRSGRTLMSPISLATDGMIFRKLMGLRFAPNLADLAKNGRFQLLQEAVAKCATLCVQARGEKKRRFQKLCAELSTGPAPHRTAIEWIASSRFFKVTDDLKQKLAAPSGAFGIVVRDGVAHPGYAVIGCAKDLDDTGQVNFTTVDFAKRRAFTIYSIPLGEVHFILGQRGIEGICDPCPHHIDALKREHRHKSALGKELASPAEGLLGSIVFVLVEGTASCEPRFVKARLIDVNPSGDRYSVYCRALGRKWVDAVKVLDFRRFSLASSEEALQEFVRLYREVERELKIDASDLRGPLSGSYDPVDDVVRTTANLPPTTAWGLLELAACECDVYFCYFLVVSGLIEFAKEAIYRVAIVAVILGRRSLLKMALSVIKQCTGFNPAFFRSDAEHLSSWVQTEEMAKTIREFWEHMNKKYDRDVLGDDRMFFDPLCCAKEGWKTELEAMAKEPISAKIATRRDSEGYGPLHLAAMGGHDELFKHLLDTAKKTSKTEEGLEHLLKNEGPLSVLACAASAVDESAAKSMVNALIDEHTPKTVETVVRESKALSLCLCRKVPSPALTKMLLKHADPLERHLGVYAFCHLQSVEAEECSLALVKELVKWQGKVTTKSVHLDKDCIIAEEDEKSDRYRILVSDTAETREVDSVWVGRGEVEIKQGDKGHFAGAKVLASHLIHAVRTSLASAVQHLATPDTLRRYYNNALPLTNSDTLRECFALCCERIHSNDTELASSAWNIFRILLRCVYDIHTQEKHAEGGPTVADRETVPTFHQALNNILGENLSGLSQLPLSRFREAVQGYDLPFFSEPFAAQQASLRTELCKNWRDTLLRGGSPESMPEHMQEYKMFQRLQMRCTQKKNRTPLEIAVEHGWVKAVRWMLRVRRVDPNGSTTSDTPIAIVAEELRRKVEQIKGNQLEVFFNTRGDVACPQEYVDLMRVRDEVGRFNTVLFPLCDSMLEECRRNRMVRALVSVALVLISYGADPEPEDLQKLGLVIRLDLTFDATIRRQSHAGGAAPPYDQVDDEVIRIEQCTLLHVAAVNNNARSVAYLLTCAGFADTVGSGIMEDTSGRTARHYTNSHLCHKLLADKEHEQQALKGYLPPAGQIALVIAIKVEQVLSLDLLQICRDRLVPASKTRKAINPFSTTSLYSSGTPPLPRFPVEVVDVEAEAEGRERVGQSGEAVGDLTLAVDKSIGETAVRDALFRLDLGGFVIHGDPPPGDARSLADPAPPPEDRYLVVSGTHNRLFLTAQRYSHLVRANRFQQRNQNVEQDRPGDETSSGDDDDVPTPTFQQASNSAANSPTSSRAGDRLKSIAAAVRTRESLQVAQRVHRDLRRRHLQAMANLNYYVDNKKLLSQEDHIVTSSLVHCFTWPIHELKVQEAITLIEDAVKNVSDNAKSLFSFSLPPKGSNFAKPDEEDAQLAQLHNLKHWVRSKLWMQYGHETHYPTALTVGKKHGGPPSIPEERDLSGTYRLVPREKVAAVLEEYSVFPWLSEEGRETMAKSSLLWRGVSVPQGAQTATWDKDWVYVGEANLLVLYRGTWSLLHSHRRLSESFHYVHSTSAPAKMPLGEQEWFLAEFIDHKPIPALDQVVDDWRNDPESFVSEMGDRGKTRQQRKQQNQQKRQPRSAPQVLKLAIRDDEDVTDRITRWEPVAYCRDAVVALHKDRWPEPGRPYRGSYKRLKELILALPDGTPQVFTLESQDFPEVRGTYDRSPIMSDQLSWEWIHRTRRELKLVCLYSKTEDTAGASKRSQRDAQTQASTVQPQAEKAEKAEKRKLGKDEAGGTTEVRRNGITVWRLLSNNEPMLEMVSSDVAPWHIPHETANWLNVSCQTPIPSVKFKWNDERSGLSQKQCEELLSLKVQAMWGFRQLLRAAGVLADDLPFAQCSRLDEDVPNIYATPNFDRFGHVPPGQKWLDLLGHHNKIVQVFGIHKEDEVNEILNAWMPNLEEVGYSALFKPYLWQPFSSLMDFLRENPSADEERFDPVTHTICNRSDFLTKEPLDRHTSVDWDQLQILHRAAQDAPLFMEPDDKYFEDPSFGKDEPPVTTEGFSNVVSELKEGAKVILSPITHLWGEVFVPVEAWWLPTETPSGKKVLENSQVPAGDSANGSTSSMCFFHALRPVHYYQETETGERLVNKKVPQLMRGQEVRVLYLSLTGNWAKVVHHAKCVYFKRFFLPLRACDKIVSTLQPRYLGQLGLVEQYLGSKIAFYFAFTATYCAYLLLLLMTGMLFTVVQLVTGLHKSQKVVLWNTIVVLIWSSVFRQAWMRKASELAHFWSVRNVEQWEPPMADFLKNNSTLDKRPHRITGIPEPYIPKRTKLKKYWVTTTITAAMACFVVCTMYFNVVLRDEYTSGLHGYEQTFAKLFFGVQNAGCVAFMDAMFAVIADHLNAYENHRTKSSFQGSAIIKGFTFRILNGFSGLIFTVLRSPKGVLDCDPRCSEACMSSNAPITGPPICPSLDDIEANTALYKQRDLMVQLTTMLVVQSALSILFEKVIPKALLLSRQKEKEARAKATEKFPNAFSSFALKEILKDISCDQLTISELQNYTVTVDKTYKGVVRHCGGEWELVPTRTQLKDDNHNTRHEEAATQLFHTVTPASPQPQGVSFAQSAHNLDADDNPRACDPKVLYKISHIGDRVSLTRGDKVEHLGSFVRYDDDDKKDLPVTVKEFYCDSPTPYMSEGGSNPDEERARLNPRVDDLEQSQSQEKLVVFTPESKVSSDIGKVIFCPDCPSVLKLEDKSTGAVLTLHRRLECLSGLTSPASTVNLSREDCRQSGIPLAAKSFVWVYGLDHKGLGDPMEAHIKEQEAKKKIDKATAHKLRTLMGFLVAGGFAYTDKYVALFWRSSVC